MVAGMDALGWEALGTWVTAAVALAAAIFAWRQVREARILREEQAQPQVTAFLGYDETPASIDIVVRNYGARPAFDIKLACTPTLRRATGGVEEIGLPDVLPVLAPGQEWRTWFDGGIGRMNSTELAGEDRYDVRLTYRDSRDVSYAVATVLDFAQFRPVLYQSRKTIDDLARSVAELTTAVKAFSEGQRGLSAYIRDGAFKDEQDQIEREERRRRCRGTEGPEPDAP